jgi:hypothetical protein
MMASIITQMGWKIGEAIVNLATVGCIDRGQERNHLMRKTVPDVLWVIAFAGILCDMAIFQVLLQGPIMHYSYAQTYNSTVNLSGPVPFAADPHISISGKNIYEVWTASLAGESTNGGRNSGIFFSKSVDSGASFSKPVAITNYKQGIKQEPRIAVSGKNIYIIWSDYSLGAAEIYFTKSTNNGVTFSMPVALGTSFGAAEETRLSAFGDSVYVLWIGSANGVTAGAVLFRTSSDEGNTFSNTTSISSNGIASKPEMSISGNNVYVVWYNSTLTNSNVIDDQILFTRSTNNGAHFDSQINLSNNPNSFSSRPQVEASGKNVYVAWLESGPNHTLNIANTYFARSVDDGATFSTPIRFSNNVAANNYSFNFDTPKIASSNSTYDDNVYVLWAYTSSSNSSLPQKTDLFISRSANGGASFSSPFKISSGLGLRDESINVLTNPNNNADEVGVMWSADTGSRTLGYEIFISLSMDNGISFSNPVDESNVIGLSLFPEMIINGSSLCFTWTEYNHGSYSILFKTISLGQVL